MLARRSALVVLGNLVGAVLGWVILKFVTTYFGGGAFGSVGFALAIVGLFELFSDMGLTRAYVKRVSEGVSAADAYATFRQVKLALVALMAGLVGLSLFGWTVVLGRPILTTTVPVILVSLGYAVVRAWLPLRTGLFEAERQPAKIQAVSLAENIVRLPIIVVLSYLLAASTNEGPWTGAPPEVTRWVSSHAAELLAATYLVGSLASFIVAWWLSRAVRPGAPSPELRRRLWRFATPIFLAVIAGTLSGYLDRVAVGFYGDDLQVAYYCGAQRLTSVLQFIPIAVSLILFPTISERHGAGDAGGARALADVAERWSTFFVAPTIFFFLYLHRPIINVFMTVEFQPAAPVLVLLAAYALVLGLYYIHLSLLGGIDAPGVQARAALLALSVNLVLLYVLVPDRGFHFIVPVRYAVGAALSTLVAFTVALLYLLVQAWRVAGKRPSPHVPIQLAVALVLGYLMSLVASWWEPVRWWQLGIFAAGYFVVYAATLVAVRELPEAELRVFLNAVNPAQLLRHVREELRQRPR
jgi:O-antigen/teichoic acid export membrane protein